MQRVSNGQLLAYFPMGEPTSPQSFEADLVLDLRDARSRIRALEAAVAAAKPIIGALREHTDCAECGRRAEEFRAALRALASDKEAADGAGR